MRKLESFVQLLSGRFNNAAQYEARKEEGFPYAEHVNTPCNHKIRGLPADFDGVFLLEESYYTTDGRTPCLAAPVPVHRGGGGRAADQLRGPGLLPEGLPDGGRNCRNWTTRT